MPDWLYWTVLFVLSVPVWYGFGWVIFDGIAEFFECIKYWLMPDIISWIRGEGFDDMGAEFKLFIWGLMCFGASFGLHWLAQTYIISG